MLLFTSSNACPGSEVHVIMRYIACCSAIHPFRTSTSDAGDWVHFWFSDLQILRIRTYHHSEIICRKTTWTHPEIENQSPVVVVPTSPSQFITTVQRPEASGSRPSALSIGQLLFCDANAGGKQCVGMAVTSEPTMQSCVTSAGCLVSAMVKFVAAKLQLLLFFEMQRLVVILW